MQVPSVLTEGWRILYPLYQHKLLSDLDKKINKYTIHQGTPGYTRVHQGTPGYTRVHQGTPGYTGVHQGTPRYSRVHLGTPGYNRVHQGIRIYSHLLKSCLVQCREGYPV